MPPKEAAEITMREAIKLVLRDLDRTSPFAKIGKNLKGKLKEEWDEWERKEEQLLIDGIYHDIVNDPESAIIREEVEKGVYNAEELAELFKAGMEIVAESRGEAISFKTEEQKGND